MIKKVQYIVFLSIMAVVWGVQGSFACTNFLISKGATVDGSTMITYAADSHTLYGELYYQPAQDYPAGALRDIYEWDTGKFMGRIPQVAHTNSVIGNMNEFQVAIGETTYGGREVLFKQSGAIMDYGSIIYVALQRAKSAREAIEVMTGLVEKYGYASEGESFSISDPNEVWIMLLLTLLLKLGWVKVAWVKGISDFLVKNLPLFFVPPGVAVMLYLDVIEANFWSILVAALGSTIIVLALTGWTHQLLRKSKSFSGKRSVQQPS